LCSVPILWGPRDAVEGETEFTLVIVLVKESEFKSRFGEILDGKVEGKEDKEDKKRDDEEEGDVGDQDDGEVG